MSANNWVIAIFLLVIVCCVPSFIHVFHSAALAKNRTTDLFRLRQVVNSMLLYLDDNDGVFPPEMGSSAMLQTTLSRYQVGPSGQLFGNQEGIFSEIVGNAKLEGLRADKLDYPNKTIEVFSQMPEGGGSWDVGYVDGHTGQTNHLDLHVDL